MRTKTEERVPFPWHVKEPLMKETKGRCAHCGTPLDRYSNLTVDHIIPLSKGGTNDPSNLTVLCDDCNTEKSDMVVRPASWYPFLPAWRRKELVKDLSRYIADVDFLSFDCMVPVDTFRIQTFIASRDKSRKKHGFNLPIFIDGKKLDRDTAFEWLMEYKTHVQYRDGLILHRKPQDITTTYYLLQKGDIDVAMVNPQISRRWVEQENSYGNTFLFDWFFAPRMPRKDYIPQMLSYVVDEMDRYVNSAISGTMKGASIVLIKHRCVFSDRWCDPVFDIVENMRNNITGEWGKPKVIEEFDTEIRMSARIRTISGWAILGEKSEQKRIEAELKEKVEDGVTMIDVARYSEALNKRLDVERR